MIDTQPAQSWIFEQTPELIAFFIGVFSTYFFVSVVFKSRVKSLQESIEYLRKELAESERRCRETTDNMNSVIESMQKRINMLEDSRSFILHNTIKDLKEMIRKNEDDK